MLTRIREAVDVADIAKLCHAFGTEAGEPRCLGDAQNLVFSVNDGYVMKFIHESHRSLEQLKAEAEFIACLERGGVKVSHQLLHEGSEYIPYRNKGESFWVCVETKAKGVEVLHNNKALYNENLFELWGKTTAMMHRAAMEFRPKYPRFMFTDDPSIAGAEELLNKFCGSDYAALYHKTLDRILSLPMDSSCYGTVHYDLHNGNFFLNNDELQVFDFDDCCLAHYFADIVVGLYAHLNLPLNDFTRQAQEFLTPFMRGYEKLMPVDERFKRELNHFMRYRYFLLLLFIITDYDLSQARVQKLFKKYEGLASVGRYFDESLRF